MELSISQILQLDQLKEEVKEDATLQPIVRELQVNPSSRPNYVLVDGHLLFKSRLYLPKGLGLIPLMLKEGHDGLVGGHSSFLKTYKRIAIVYWVGIKRDIQQYVQ